MMLNENDLRLLIRNILLEQEEPEGVEGADAEATLQSPQGGLTPFELSPSGRKKADILIPFLEKYGLKNLKNTNKRASEIRIGLSEKVEENEIILILTKAFEEILSGRAIGIRVIGPGEQGNYSDSFNAYKIDGIFPIVFGGIGQTSGKRKGGYIYEEKIANSLGYKPTTDVAKTDIIIPVKGKDIGIEVKLLNAQLGEVTVQFNYEDEKFELGDRVNEYKQSMVDEFNESIKDLNKTTEKFDIIKHILKIGGAKFTKISKEEYNDIVKIEFKKRGLLLTLASSLRTSEDVIKLYLNKQATLIQVAGKGLYHLHEDYKIIFKNSGKQTKLFKTEGIMKSRVMFANDKDKRYLKMSTDKSSKFGLPTLEKSEIDLDSEADVFEFKKYIESRGKETVDLNESIQGRWQVLANIK